MSGEERVVVVVGEVKVADVRVAPVQAPFLLQMFASCCPDAVLYLEGEPQDAASIEAMLMAALAGRTEPPGVSEPQAPEAPGLATLATADLVMRSLAQFQAETFTSIMAANKDHLTATLALDADFAKQMFEYRENLRLALQQLHVVDRGAHIADVTAKHRLLDAQARGKHPTEERPGQGVTFGDVFDGLHNVATGPANSNNN